MREIKFEYMVKLGNIYEKKVFPILRIEGSQLKFNGLSLSKIIGYGGTVIRRQYTGLKDKNGKEIYEGDIVSITFSNGHSNDCVSVDENSYCITKVIFDYQGVYFVEHDGTWFYAPALISDDCMFEVIGNIYENKELLK